MPKVSQEHLDARRAQILDGAERAFARWGYEGTTVARLEAEIGLSRGAIFNYFPGKKALFAEVTLKGGRRFARVVPEQGLEAAIRETAAESPEALGVAAEAVARIGRDPEFLELLAAGSAELEGLRAWFVQQQRSGAFRSDIPALDLGRFATMVVNGLALRMIAGDETNLDATVRLLYDALAPRG